MSQPNQSALATIPANQLPSRLSQEDLDRVNMAQVLFLSPNRAMLEKISPYFSPFLNVVRLDLSENSNDVYGGKTSKTGKLPQWHNNDANLRSLAGGGLDKIARAAGIEWDPDRSQRVDPAPWTNNYVTFKAVAWARRSDGTMEPFFAHKSMTPGDLPPGVPIQHLATNCETKARLRVIRKFLSIKQVYTLQELQRPILVPCIVFDSSSPEAKKMALAAGAQSIAGIYGKPLVLPDGMTEEETEQAAKQMAELGRGGRTVHAGAALPAGQPQVQERELPPDEDDDDQTMPGMGAAADEDDPVAVYEAFKRDFTAATDFAQLTAVSQRATAKKDLLGEFWATLCDHAKKQQERIKEALAAKK